MCTSTALVAEAAVAQPLISTVLWTVVLSGIVTSVPLVATQPAELLTVTVSAADRVIEAAVAVMVTGALLRLAPSAALTVTVLDSPAVTVTGSNETVTPAGVVPAANVTGSASPLTSAVLTVRVVDVPGSTAVTAADRVRAKSLPVEQ